MTDDKLRVLCSQCATRLTVAAESTRKEFTCVKCGERTTRQLGATLRTTADASGEVKGLKTPVVCSHCATRLTLPAQSTSEKFKCVRCGERTTRQLGAALAQNTTADHSDGVKVVSGDLKAIRIILGVVVGVTLMALGTYTQLHGCSFPQPSKPNVVVVTPDR
jgi:predicted RNA-binding Zn-ribbon protein involved in translation (DUF1610 family)